jgi:pilus assembly protein CpaC
MTIRTIAIAVVLAGCWRMHAQTAPARELSLSAGRGELLHFPNEVTRVVVSEPRIADALVVSPTEVMVNAKGPGRTTLIVWETGSTPARYDVNVSADASDFDALRRELRDAVPDAAIDVKGNAETLVLTGSVTDPEHVQRTWSICFSHHRRSIRARFSFR